MSDTVYVTLARDISDIILTDTQGTTWVRGHTTADQSGMVTIEFYRNTELSWLRRENARLTAALEKAGEGK